MNHNKFLGFSNLCRLMNLASSSASASKPKNLVSASWVLASASWVLASASWVLASASWIWPRPRGSWPRPRGSWPRPRGGLSLGIAGLWARKHHCYCTTVQRLFHFCPILAKSPEKVVQQSGDDSVTPPTTVTLQFSKLDELYPYGLPQC